MKTVAAALLLAFALTACASKEKGPGPVPERRQENTAASDQGGGGGLWDLLDQAQRDKSRRKPRVAMDAGASQLTPEVRMAVEEWWEAWRGRSESIEEKTKALLSHGVVAKRIMVENLIRWYVLARDSASGYEADRTRTELFRYQAEVTPYLVDGLARGLGDSALRNMLGELLGDFGDDALPFIEQGIAKATPKGRLALARCLKLMSTSRAVPLLIGLCSPENDYRIRIEAIEGLRSLKAEEAVPVYVRCLEDQDPSVRKFAARAAVSPRVADPALLQALVDCLERSLSAGERDAARACVYSLNGLTGLSHGGDVRAWRRAIASRGR